MELFYKSVCPYVRLSVCPAKLDLKGYNSSLSDPIFIKIVGNTYHIIIYEYKNQPVNSKVKLSLSLFLYLYLRVYLFTYIVKNE